MAVGPGPNAAVRRWGGLMAGRYRKNNSEAKDFTTTHLGYDTDNGAFYYCECAGGGAREGWERWAHTAITLL